MGRRRMGRLISLRKKEGSVVQGMTLFPIWRGYRRFPNMGKRLSFVLQRLFQASHVLFLIALSAFSPLPLIVRKSHSVFYKPCLYYPGMFAYCAFISTTPVSGRCCWVCSKICAFTSACTRAIINIGLALFMVVLSAILGSATTQGKNNK